MKAKLNKALCKAGAGPRLELKCGEALNNSGIVSFKWPGEEKERKELFIFYLWRSYLNSFFFVFEPFFLFSLSSIVASYGVLRKLRDDILVLLMEEKES